MTAISPPLVFISHSHAEAALAELFVDLLRAALMLRSTDIRCTSVGGQGLVPGGAVEDQLRTEVMGCAAVIALLSPKSMNSAYVLFEMGARWGSEKPWVPMITHDMDPSSVQGPAAGHHLLRCDDQSDLYSLIREVGRNIGREAEPPETYTRHLQRILDHQPEAPKGESVAQAPSSTAPSALSRFHLHEVYIGSSANRPLGEWPVSFRGQWVNPGSEADVVDGVAWGRFTLANGRVVTVPNLIVRPPSAPPTGSTDLRVETRLSAFGSSLPEGWMQMSYQSSDLSRDEVMGQIFPLEGVVRMRGLLNDRVIESHLSIPLPIY